MSDIYPFDAAAYIAGATPRQTHAGPGLDPDATGAEREPADAASYRVAVLRREAREHGVLHEAPEPASLEDFWAYLPMHSYIFAPTRDLWPGGSVNSQIPPIGKMRASDWLDRNRAVEQMTWMPGEDMVVRGRLVSDGGWIERPGNRVFNLYRPPAIAPGDGSQAGPWLDHVRRVYPEDAEHIIKWLAHRAQRPHEKINHALVLGGAQGIGKDTILEPVKHAIGPWNCAEVSPAHLLGRFNGFVKSVILRISEAHDLGDTDRFAFYDHLKLYTAAPPDVFRCDEKNVKEYAVFNVCGVIITTNHKTDGIYLPADDRRHFVAWSDASKDDFTESYWNNLYHWFEHGGNAAVTAHLRGLDLSGFNPKAPPPKTPAFFAIVNASRAPEDAEMADALDALDSPAAITFDDIIRNADEDFTKWLKDRKNARQIPHRLEDAGYVAVNNEWRRDGRWKVRGKNLNVYARKELSLSDQIQAARKLAGDH